jgi:hypothetical protein
MGGRHMTAVRALCRAREAGVLVSLDGDHLRLSAAYPPAADLLDALRNHKYEIVGILSGDTCRRCGVHPQPPRARRLQLSRLVLRRLPRSRRPPGARPWGRGRPGGG